MTSTTVYSLCSLLLVTLLLIHSISASQAGSQQPSLNRDRRASGNIFSPMLQKTHGSERFSREARAHSDNSRFIMQLLDAAIADAEDRGEEGEVIEDLMHKRSGIRKCFFHAVNCW